MSECRDNQEVGLEAAILERVRNSSLVKCSGAENVTGLKLVTEAAGAQAPRVLRAVGERPRTCEAAAQASRGGSRSENAGMSNERGARIPSTDCPRVPEQRSSAQGQSGPKARPKGVADGQRVDIPVPPHAVMTDGVTGKAKGTQAMVVLGQARSQSR